jgi:OOP family OmpA-OmpF porin
VLQFEFNPSVGSAPTNEPREDNVKKLVPSEARLAVAVAVLAVVTVAGCASAPPPMEFESGTIDTDYVVPKVDQFAIVVDGSLSMADRWARQKKLGIATGAGQSLAATVPDGEFQGEVWTFGTGSCKPAKGVSSLYGLQSFQGAAAADAIAGVDCAGGKSPLGDAVEASGGEMTAKDVAVFIISDGRHMDGKAQPAARALHDAIGDGLCYYPILVGDDPTGARVMGEIASITGCSNVVMAPDLVTAAAMAGFVEKALYEKDSDGDGVADRLDQCPDTPKGVEVDEVGCPIDSDGDGVPDYLDKCPGTPAGVKVDATGCPIDSDGDGVPDYLDKCPGTPAGVKVDANGCPLDSDGDGVPDYLDKCPGTPKGTPVDATGCPLAGVRMEGGEWHVDGAVLFTLNKADIRSDAKPVLDGIADYLARNPGVRVHIEGHTDDTGTTAWNQKLSEMRAASAKAYLVSKGVAGDRLTTSGAGESDPFVPNTSAENRARNRRVEFQPK